MLLKIIDLILSGKECAIDRIDAYKLAKNPSFKE